MNRPEVIISFESPTSRLAPGDFLSVEYSIDVAPEIAIIAVEASVIWLTEGKGESDIGVHFFQRRKKGSLPRSVFRQPQRFSTVLPASPLTYEGRILNVRWQVRVRLFLADGGQVTKDAVFRLGNIQPFPPKEIANEDSAQPGQRSQLKFDTEDDQ